jgi:hypothetical protein
MNKLLEFLIFSIFHSFLHKKLSKNSSKIELLFKKKPTTNEAIKNQSSFKANRGRLNLSISHITKVKKKIVQNKNFINYK